MRSLQEPMMMSPRRIKIEFQEVDTWQVMENLQLWVAHNILGCTGIPIWKPKFNNLEQEAYSSVLRAFKAQADAITWEKEGLITELRKELRLSNEEHRELLLKSSGLQPGMVNPGQAVHDPLPSPSVSGNRKKQKMNPSGHSQSFGGPRQHVPLPTPSSARRAPVTGPKGKNKKSMMGGLSSIKTQHPPSGSTTGRAQLGNRVTSGAHANETAETPSFSPLIGRQVRTRWPEDNNFYEATITDYNPVEVI
ncbi:putative ENT domain, protein EMSY-LIKE, plant, ENT domain-like superfamily [Helianthus debilis subsp. tardiflorus]